MPIFPISPRLHLTRGRLHGTGEHNPEAVRRSKYLRSMLEDHDVVVQALLPPRTCQTRANPPAIQVDMSTYLRPLQPHERLLHRCYLGRCHHPTKKKSFPLFCDGAGAVRHLDFPTNRQTCAVLSSSRTTADLHPTQWHFTSQYPPGRCAIQRLSSRPLSSTPLSSLSLNVSPSTQTLTQSILSNRPP